MAIYALYLTECYQCGCELMAGKEEVHPLCSDCKEEHRRWLANELKRMFDE